jgi:hypothetical protein
MAAEFAMMEKGRGAAWTPLTGIVLPDAAYASA